MKIYFSKYCNKFSLHPFQLNYMVTFHILNIFTSYIKIIIKIQQ